MRTPKYYFLLLALLAGLVPTQSTDWSHRAGCVTFESAHFGPTGLVPYPEYGTFLAADDNLLVVTAPYYTYPNSTEETFTYGRAYVYQCNTPTSCIQIQILTAPDREDGDHFGITVDVAGGLVAVGAHRLDHSGAVYLYECKGRRLRCTYLSTLSPPYLQPNDYFGTYLFISKPWLVVGVSGHNNNTGYVEVYKCCDPRHCIKTSTIEASDPTELTQFGGGIHFSGSLLAIGAIQTNDYTGAAYVYECDKETLACVQIAKLTPPASFALPFGAFGLYITIHGDIVYISDPFSSTNPGAVFVYSCPKHYHHHQHQQQQRSCSLISTLIPPDALPNDQFGSFLFTYRDLLIVGAQGRNNNTGATYVYNCQNPAHCVQTDYLQASDTQSNDYFGFIIAVTKRFMAISAVPYLGGGHGQGEVYLYPSPS